MRVLVLNVVGGESWTYCTKRSRLGDLCVTVTSFFYDTESMLVPPVHRDMFQDPPWMAEPMDGIEACYVFPYTYRSITKFN